MNQIPFAQLVRIGELTEMGRERKLLSDSFKRCGLEDICSI